MAQQLAGREYALIEEDALLARLRDGDQAAFERLFLRHYAQVYRVLYHLVGSREEAEDLAQETFMALYNQPPATGMGAALIAWLCRVGLNRVYRPNNRLKHVQSIRILHPATAEGKDFSIWRAWKMSALVVGWAMAEHPETSLVGRGWQMALLATVTGRAKRRLSNFSLIDKAHVTSA